MSQANRARRRFILLAIAAVAAIGGGVAWRRHRPSTSPAPLREQVKLVIITPEIKPISTPPPLLPQPPEQKTEEPKLVLDPEPAPAAAKPQPSPAVDEPPPSMGSNIKGEDGALVGDGIGKVGPGGRGKGGGSPFGGLAPQIRSRIEAALRLDKRTREGAYRETVKLWLDADGIVTRAESTAGEKSGASAALLGVKILDRTPEGMPMPIQTSIQSVRPR